MYTNETGIECSPRATTHICGAFLALLLSLVAIASLGVIAGGAFWTAQSMYRITDKHHTMKVKFCTSSPSTGETTLDDLIKELGPCPE